MKEILIDTDGISSVSELHEYLKKKFHFPDHYGMNLDALYDCLTDISEYTEVTISRNIFLRKELNFYGSRLLEVFEDAAIQNENLHLWIQ